MKKWTEEQVRAISYAERPEILLMAGAGSGKTSVLSERVVQRLTAAEEEGQRLVPEELLVLTFTEKAARQMRQKIEERLDQLIWTEAGARPAETIKKWREIRERLALAQISTIHAFAWQVLQRYQLELAELGTPLAITKTRIISGFEQKALLDQALDQVLGARYEEMGQRALMGEEAYRDFKVALGQPELDEDDFLAFNKFLEAQDNLLDDKTLRASLRQHHTFLRSLADYREALEAAVEEAEQDSEFSLQSPSYQMIFRQTEPALARFIEAMPQLEHDDYYVKNWQKKKSKAQEYLALQALIDFFGPGRIGALRSDLELLSEVLSSASGDSSAEELSKLSQLWARWHRLGEEMMKVAPPPALRKLSSSESKTALRNFYGEEIAPFLNLLTGIFTEAALGEDYELEQYPGVYTLPQEAFAQILRDSALYGRSYADLLLELDTAYQGLKLAQNVVDFSDLEHLALKLLREPEIQAHVAASYREIYIDEYQDTSPLQDELLEQLGREGQFRFMVGDVKQSIYRFRHAEPALFMARAELLAQHPERGETLLLSTNFRTQSLTLDYINELFNRLMTRSSTGISYADRQMLLAGRELECDAGANRPVQLNILCHPAKAGEVELPEGGFGAYTETVQSILDGRREIDWTALETVREILRYRQKGYQYQDIMLLCRTNGQIENIAGVLQLFDIPVAATRKFKIDSQQLLLLTHLVEILENPEQDIPLLAYLRSALHGEVITEEDLLQVAKAYDHALPTPELKQYMESTGGPYFHQKLKAYLEGEHQTGSRERLARAMAQVQIWREALTLRSYPEVLEEIVGVPAYREYLAALDSQDGLDRLFDLELFFDWVHAAYEEGRPFHRLVEAIKEQRDEMMELDVEQKPSSAGRVQLLTIHRAKGLESPVVILAATEESLWQNRSSHFVSLSTAPGGGLVPATGAAYDFTEGEYPLALGSLGYVPDFYQRLNLPRETALSEAEKREEMGENYRLLYVALTRAEEEISILANLRQDKLKERISQAEEFMDGLETRPRYAKSYLEMLLADLQAEDPSLAQTFAEVQKSELRKLELTPRTQLGLALRSEEELLRELQTALAERAAELQELPEDAGSETAEEALAASLAMAELSARPMPRRALLELPGKVTVSDLSKAARGAADILPAADSDTEEAPESHILAREMGLSIEPLSIDVDETGMTPTAYGSFLHRLFLYLDPELIRLARGADDTVLSAALEAHYAQVANQGLIEPSELELLTASEVLDYLRAFCRSDLAEEMASAQQVERERPFTLALRAGDFAPELGSDEAEEIIAVQGMIDLFYVDEAGEITLVDYKSDRLPEDESLWTEIMQERYGSQVYYYREALERILKRPVKRTLLWLIRAGRELEILR